MDVAWFEGIPWFGRGAAVAGRVGLASGGGKKGGCPKGIGAWR